MSDHGHGGGSKASSHESVTPKQPQPEKTNKEQRKVVVPEQKVKLSADEMYDDPDFRVFLAEQVVEDVNDEKTIKKMFKVYETKQEAVKLLTGIAKEVLSTEFKTAGAAIDRQDFSNIAVGLDSRLAAEKDISEKLELVKTIVGEIKMHKVIEDHVRELQDQAAKEFESKSLDELRKRQVLLDMGRGSFTTNIAEPILNKVEAFKNIFTKKGREENRDKKFAQKQITKELGIESQDIEEELKKVGQQIAIAEDLENSSQMLGNIRANLKNLALAGGDVRAALKEDSKKQAKASMEAEAARVKKNKPDEPPTDEGDGKSEVETPQKGPDATAGAPKPPDVVPSPTPPKQPPKPGEVKPAIDKSDKKTPPKSPDEEPPQLENISKEEEDGGEDETFQLNPAERLAKFEADQLITGEFDESTLESLKQEAKEYAEKIKNEFKDKVKKLLDTKISKVTKYSVVFGKLKELAKQSEEDYLFIIKKIDYKVKASADKVQKMDLNRMKVGLIKFFESNEKKS